MQESMQNGLPNVMIQSKGERFSLALLRHEVGTPFSLKRTPSQKEGVHINAFMFQQHTLMGTPGQLVSGIRGYRIKEKIW